MRIYVYPADVHGCGYIRLIWVSRVLAAQGHHITIVMPGTKSPFEIKGQIQDGKTVAASAPADADVMVFQRITHRRLSEAIPLFRAKGIAVVMDMDDDLTCIHPSNPAWRALRPSADGAFGWDVAQDSCRDATLVTVSTDALAERYAPHGRVSVLRNCLPERYLDIPHTDSDVVGWGGALASHPDDLTVLGPAMARHTATGGHFRVVGPPNGVREFLGIETNWSASGGVHINQWPHQLASDLGIGIAPLADTRFNAAKSWLKPLEYAFLGIPAVMSPRVEYARLHAEGVGMLAKRPRDWERVCRDLAADPLRRKELGEAGRSVAARYTIEANAWRWLEAWQRAYDIQRGRAS